MSPTQIKRFINSRRFGTGKKEISCFPENDLKSFLKRCNLPDKAIPSILDEILRLGDPQGCVDSEKVDEYFVLRGRIPSINCDFRVAFYVCKDSIWLLDILCGKKTTTLPSGFKNRARKHMNALKATIEPGKVLKQGRD